MLTLLLMPVILATGHALDLQTSHNNVIPNLTDDVTLRCYYDNRTKSYPVISQVLRLRLEKQMPSLQWKTIAEISVKATSNASLTQSNDPNVIISGNLGRAEQSFLSITWSYASADTVGIYQCELDGFEGILGNYVHINTNVVNITTRVPSTKELVDIMVQMKHLLKTKIKDNLVEVRYWPSGNYTLLSAATGCPDTPFSKMVRGFATLESQTAIKPNHIFSSPSHLPPDTFKRIVTRNVLHFRFCRNPDDQVVRVAQWPKGSYCIHNYNWPICPHGFRNGLIRGFLESSSKLVTDESNIKDSFDGGNNFFNFIFCCRDDGDPDVPVLLPNKKPFYLYRYHGKCQTVNGMKVSPEFMEIDTDDSKTDIYSASLNTPDNTLNDVRLQMCYYESQN